jgi:lipopolysaccharide/colanic/teichoic acid biosynthesis glycosyltransferase
MPNRNLSTIEKILLTTVTTAGVAFTIAAVKDQKEQNRNEAVAEKNHINLRRPSSKYEQYIKRPLDFILSTGAAVVLSPVLLINSMIVKNKLGSPVLFTQERPGKIDPATGKESIFKLYKFRTMTDEKDEKGKLLPDEKRLTQFGAWLRSTSLDELPELFNIIKGDMAIIGPRPQLVRDMVFMTDKQRQRHSVRPGLSGLAQVRGRNAISWEGKLNTDLEYIKKISFREDARIIFETIKKVLVKEGITEEGQATAEDFGDYLLKKGKITDKEYKVKQIEAKEILKGKESSTLDKDDVDLVYMKEVLPGKMKWNLESLKKFNFLREIGMMFKTVGAVGKE